MWNKEEHIVSCTEVNNKLLQHLRDKGISIRNMSNNILFKKGDKEYIMSHHSYYRFSGRAAYYRETETTLTPFELTYEMYVNTIIKPIIEKMLL